MVGAYVGQTLDGCHAKLGAMKDMVKRPPEYRVFDMECIEKSPTLSWVKHPAYALKHAGAV